MSARPRAPRGRARSIALVFGCAFILALIVAALWAPLPYDPVKPDATSVLQAPSSEHPFGTDRSGFDIFSRTVAAAKNDLPLALAGTALSLLMGLPLGLLASTRGPMGERVMRGLDAFQAFPLLVLAISVVTLTGNRLEAVVLAIAVINVPRFMRLVRSEVLTIRETRYVEAAVAIGASPVRVMGRHIIPNIIPILVAQSSLTAAHSIVVIAALSFLGIGVRPPDPTWGSMIQSGAAHMTTGQWWVVAFPGIAVFVVVAALNLIADAVTERAAEETVL